jgi:glycogen debranching enzyme
MQHRRIIKEGPIVLATSEDGSMSAKSPASQGLFLADTRFLSTFQIRLNGHRPVLLGSTEGTLFELSYLFANPNLDGIPMRRLGILQRNTLVERSGGVADVHMDITLVNWSLAPAALELSIEVGSDFFDSFEARGVHRLKRGQILEPVVTKDSVTLAYIGLDDVRDSTQIRCRPPMGSFNESCLLFPIHLDANARTTIELDFALTSEAQAAAEPLAAPQPEISGMRTPPWFDHATKITIGNDVLDSILCRSIDDLEALLTEFPGAWIPAAGLPRFAVPFGRDAIITGLETLSWNPALACDVLRFLADRQGKVENPWNYEQPGKIMHEMHTGELARLREIPFGLFYGSVDSTPLFLVLGAEYLRWTQDLEWFRELRPHFDAAWSWIDKYGDIDGSGYVQYQAHTPPKADSAALTVGLFNQGWKDSSVAVVYSDGSVVRDHPVALAEVQGYLYRALELWGQLYSTMPASEGLANRGKELLDRAATLKSKFNQEFWMEEKGYYAMALDGHHRHVDVVTSNPGHCLWSRLIDDAHAEATVTTLTKPEMLSTWGIRTMATGEKAFNAFSYHDGSIWPFENAIMMAGFKKYGFVKAAQEIHKALIEASVYFEYRRWPEVYCGVTKEAAGVLARQPDACRPQAWSSGVIFMMVQSWLGLAPRAFQRHVDVTPILPAGIQELTVKDMSVCGSPLSLRIVRENDSLLLEIVDNPGNLDIMIHPASYRERYLSGDDMPAQLR